MMHRHMHACIDVRRDNLLHKKIQSMIGNYHEHENKKEIRDLYE